jgi:signal transduction histidine kinase
MTVISGYVQLMVQAGDAEQRQSYAEMVLKQFEHIGAMTAEILAFARGESSILLRRVYLHRFIEETGELVRKELEPKGIEVVFDLQYRGTARFDEGKIRRVFHNIAHNAADAMSEGGTFTVTVAREADELVLRFADTGAGVPPEVRDSLFESFTTAGKESGTGLGLAVVKRIVDQHNGSVSYESAPGQGTTFTVKLPLEVDSKVPAGRAVAP